MLYFRCIFFIVWVFLVLYCSIWYPSDYFCIRFGWIISIFAVFCSIISVYLVFWALLVFLVVRVLFVSSGINLILVIFYAVLVVYFWYLGVSSALLLRNMLSIFMFSMFIWGVIFVM